MANRKRKMSQTEMMLHTDRQFVERVLGRSFTDKLEDHVQFADFFLGTRQDHIDDTYPKLQALMLQQYPLTSAFTDPVALDYIKQTHEITASSLIWDCWNIVEDMNKDVDVRAKYPKLEEWREFYCKPEEAEVIGRDMVHIFKGDSEETIQQRVDEENAAIKKWHEHKMKLKNAYYDLMQPLLFEHLPALHELEGDHWVIYAMTIRDSYEQWKSLCEEMETTIEYNMPQESIAWKYAEWKALFSEKYRERSHKTDRF